MIFKEIVKSKAEKLRPVFDELFDLIIKNQSHPGDLLIVNENGFYNPDVLTWDNLDRKLLPYLIGPNDEGHSEIDHHKFILAYLNSYECKITHDEYLKEVKYDPKQKDKVDQFLLLEKFSIQLEMLVYLKIWEADLFIKRFYQLARLLNGEEYDWHFKILESNRDKNSTGTRQEIIRNKIRKRFEQPLPKLFKAFENSYITQIRNAIAHSKYSFMNRYIHLNNFIKGDKSSQLHSLKFDDWIDKFHETVILYNEYIRFFNNVNSHYAEIAKKNNNLVEVKLNMKEPKEIIEYRFMEYRPEWNDFKVKLD